jgi:capsular polysaccharide biosynthesis protein
MRLTDYIKVLRKRWLLIGLVGLVAAVAAYGFSKLQTPMFRAQTTYTIVPSRIDYGLNLTLPNTAKSWPRLVLSDNVLRQLSGQLGLDSPVSTLKKNIHIQPNGEELLVLIEADAPEMGQAIGLANAVGARLQQEIANLNLLKEGTDKINIQVTEEASGGTSYLARPKTKINVLAGGILGVLLGVLLAFVAEYLDDTLKTADDVERFLGLTTLGQIPAGGAVPPEAGQRRGLGRRLKVGS